jgi:hypothetical protein
MHFLDHLIRFSLRHRVLVLAAAGLLLVVGALWVASMPVDIFPDLSASTVTVVTEAPGMAPEEIEVLVTLPLESAVNGASGVRRLRSVSADGIVVIWVEFEWGTDIYLARQVVAERLQRVELPVQAERPELGPISSIMGEITFVALTSDRTSEAGDAFELRRLAETDVRRALLAIPGISQVVPIGGRARQLQVSRTDSLGFIQTASIGGCGTPSSPSWSLEGDPTAGFDLVLSTGIPLSFCFVGLSPGLLPGPIPLFGCDIHLAPQGLFATGLIADANARLLIAISPQLAGIQLYLQALVFHTLITGSDSVNLVLK